MKNFIKANWVFVSGLISALVLTLQQFLGNGDTNWSAIALAALITVIGYMANTWRGKGVSLTGIIGTISYAFITVWNTGHFTWSQFLLSALIAVLAASAPPPKDESYEKK